MGRVIPTVASLLCGVGVLLLGNGLLGTLLGIGVADMKLGPTVSALIMGAYFLGLTLGTLQVYRMIAGFGHIRAFSILASVFSAASLLHPLISDPWTWGALRLIEGFCMAGLFMCAESWLNAQATSESRGLTLSLYMITTYACQGVAQFLLMLGDTAGIRLFAMVSVLASLAVVPVAMTRMPQPTLPEISSFGFRRLYKVSPTGVFGCLTSGLTLGSFYSLGPQFARDIGLPLDGIAAFMSAVILGGLLLQWPLGALSDRMDRRIIVIGTCIALVLSSLLIAVKGLIDPADMASGSAYWITLAMAALFGAVVAAVYPVSMALANDRLDPGDMVSASGGLLLSYSVGAVIGPLLAAPVMESVGPAGLFLFTAVIGVAMALHTLWRMTVREAVAPEDKAPFQMVARTTPVAGELDPRAPEEEEDPQLSFIFDALDADASADTAMAESPSSPSSAAEPLVAPLPETRS